MLTVCVLQVKRSGSLVYNWSSLASLMDSSTLQPPEWEARKISLCWFRMGEQKTSFIPKPFDSSGHVTFKTEYMLRIVFQIKNLPCREIAAQI